MMPILRLTLVIFLLFASNAPAFAQLLYDQGKVVGETQDNIPINNPPGSSTDPLGPVEAVIAGTRFPASAISTPDGNPPLANDTQEKNASIPVQPRNSPDWPRDTIRIFVTACAKTQTQLIAPCKCVIEHLAYAIPQNEFVSLTESGEIETDKRYLKAQSDCLGAPSNQPRS